MLPRDVHHLVFKLRIIFGLIRGERVNKSLEGTIISFSKELQQTTYLEFLSDIYHNFNKSTDNLKYNCFRVESAFEIFNSKTYILASLSPDLFSNSSMMLFSSPEFILECQKNGSFWQRYLRCCFSIIYTKFIQRCEVIHVDFKIYHIRFQDFQPSLDL